MLSMCEFREGLRQFYGNKLVFAGETEEYPPKYDTIQRARRTRLKSDTFGIKS
jgi:hypothetical protein